MSYNLLAKVSEWPPFYIYVLEFQLYKHRYKSRAILRIKITADNNKKAHKEDLVLIEPL